MDSNCPVWDIKLSSVSQDLWYVLYGICNYLVCHIICDTSICGIELFTTEMSFSWSWLYDQLCAVSVYIVSTHCYRVIKAASTYNQCLVNFNCCCVYRLCMFVIVYSTSHPEHLMFITVPKTSIFKAITVDLCIPCAHLLKDDIPLELIYSYHSIQPTKDFLMQGLTVMKSSEDLAFN